MRPCVVTRIAIRRVSRHPVTKHVVRGAVYGVVPDALNDFAFHHAPVNVDEILHATQDTLVISTVNTLVSLCLRL
jgi:hypothetical protein